MEGIYWKVFNTLIRHSDDDGDIDDVNCNNNDYGNCNNNDSNNKMMTIMIVMTKTLT